MIYVDEIKIYPIGVVGMPARRCGKYWCHMWTDYGNEEELHRFAESIGLKREWYQDKGWLPHYDLVPRTRAKAVEAGAVSMGLKEWVAENYDKIKKRARNAAYR